MPTRLGRAISVASALFAEVRLTAFFTVRFAAFLAGVRLTQKVPFGALSCFSDPELPRLTAPNPGFRVTCRGLPHHSAVQLNRRDGPRALEVHDSWQLPSSSGDTQPSRTVGLGGMSTACS